MQFYKELEQIGANEPALQQGDILHPVPFFALEIGQAELIEPGDGGHSKVVQADLTAEELPESSCYAVASFERRMGIIVTQTCDLERRNRPVALAPIRPYTEEFAGGEIGSNKFFERIKEMQNPGRAPAIFLLPEFIGRRINIGYSVADLLRIQTFPPINIEALERVRQLRLGDEALGAFQERLAYCFGRRAVREDLYIGRNQMEAWRRWRAKRG